MSGKREQDSSIGERVPGRAGPAFALLGLVFPLCQEADKTPFPHLVKTQRTSGGVVTWRDRTTQER